MSNGFEKDLDRFTLEEKVFNLLRFMDLNQENNVVFWLGVGLYLGSDFLDLWVKDELR